MGSQEDVHDGGAIYRSGRIPAPNFAPTSSGTKNPPPRLSYEMLLCSTSVICVPTPCIPGCSLNNVDSLTTASMHCPMYGVEHYLNE